MISKQVCSISSAGQPQRLSDCERHLWILSLPSKRRPRKQQQYRSSLPTHILAKCHTNELRNVDIAKTKALRMIGPCSMNIIKSNQNVHLREQRSGSVHACQTGQSQSCEPMTYAKSLKVSCLWQVRTEQCRYCAI